MARKRKCEMTPEEQAIHAEAVSLRKMSDRQLVEELRRTDKTETRVNAAEMPSKPLPATNTSNLLLM